MARISQKTNLQRLIDEQAPDIKSDAVSSGILSLERLPSIDYSRLPISSSNVNNWNTAYGWGNHAEAGYAELSGIQTFTGLKTFYAGLIARTSLGTQGVTIQGDTPEKTLSIVSTQYPLLVTRGPNPVRMDFEEAHDRVRIRNKLNVEGSIKANGGIVGFANQMPDAFGAYKTYAAVRKLSGGGWNRGDAVSASDLTDVTSGTWRCMGVTGYDMMGAAIYSAIRIA